MEIIAQHGQIFIILAIVFGAYMCWGIGANDVANSMGPPVGSGAITIKNALIIAAIFEFLGAFLAGGEVTDTIKSGIINTKPYIEHPEILLYGMLAALLSSAIWLMLATMRGWPVSTTHSIIGAIVGFGLVSQGMDGIKWGKLGEIVASWLVSPLMGGAIAFALMLSIRHLVLNKEDPFVAAKKWAPFYVFLVGWSISLVTLWKGFKHLNIKFSNAETHLIAIGVGVALAVVGSLMVNKIKHDAEADKKFHFASAEKVFVPLMVFTAAGMCFAHGSNDVANGIGPVAAVVSFVEHGGQIAKKSALPAWILLMGGGAMVVGLATYGYKVMQTLGHSITELTPSRAYAATLATSATVIVASMLGLPVSTSQIAVGGVMGVGLARGVGAIDLRVLGGIVVSWLLTLPVAGVGAALVYFILKGMFS